MKSNIDYNTADLTTVDLSTVSNVNSSERYKLMDNQLQWNQKFNTNTFDANGDISSINFTDLLDSFNKNGYLHIANTGLDAKMPNDIPMEILEKLGFGEEDQFKWGGLTSGRTNLKYISKAMRETDKYPIDKFLLPHNEILYQRFMPEKLLFYCATATLPGNGGRTFSHSAKDAEAIIYNSGEEGRALLDKIYNYGFTIVTGFLDEKHPEKSKNYFRSWQDRFETNSRDEALAKCIESKDQFDSCYWVEEEVKNTDNKPCFTLMTSITIPAYKKDERDGETYMFFPRVALDDPMAHNGYRRFLIGEEELTKVETAILLQAFMDTREGDYYNAGDMLLVDNIRYGHSRESFTGDRNVYASMAGTFWIDDLK